MRLLTRSLLVLGLVAAGLAPSAAHAANGPRSCSPNERFVNATFQDFLGREVDNASVLYWGTRLDGGLPREQYAAILASSDEWIARIVDRFYMDVFGRPADSSGRSFWIDRMRNGEPVVSVAAFFYSSDEHFASAGSTVDGWVRLLYTQLLERQPDDAGVAYWVARSTQVGRRAVAADFYQSREKRNRRVDALYQSLLHRPSDSAGRDYWASVILTRGDLALASFLAASGEYFTRAQAVDPTCPLPAGWTQLSGTGSQIPSFTKPRAGEPVVADISNTGGSSNFQVWERRNGVRGDLLVNEIGAYSGTVLIDRPLFDDGDSNALEIVSDGSWTITIRPLSTARAFSGPVAGRGDDVLAYSGSASAARLTHNGQSNFAIWSYGTNDADLVVNEIGPYDGVRNFPPGPRIIEVSADGDWSV
ncbi:MAG: DUF4214 domain-containing protein, partial [Myxococcota bacterium]|nr:DUF4214 domain-containing protein [Myxococcota bacterium]